MTLKNPDLNKLAPTATLDPLTPEEIAVKNVIDAAASASAFKEFKGWIAQSDIHRMFGTVKVKGANLTDDQAKDLASASGQINSALSRLYKEGWIVKGVQTRNPAGRKGRPPAWYHAVVEGVASVDLPDGLRLSDEEEEPTPAPEMK